MVRLFDIAFSPTTINIPIGGKVTWTNDDSVPHTVTSLTRLFDSGALSRGGTYTFTFTQAGTYQYRCDIHPSMKGTIIVGEEAANSSSSSSTPPASQDSSGDYNY